MTNHYPIHMQPEIAQGNELDRVATNIADIVLEFCRARMRDALGVFRLVELEQYVQSRRRVTPGSPGRILRALNHEGRVSYYCSDRATSTYVIQSVL